MAASAFRHVLLRPARPTVAATFLPLKARHIQHMSENTKTTVYFDGACPLCRREIAIYQKAQSDDLEFVDVSASDFASMPDLTRDEALKRFHVRQPDGQLLDGGVAFRALWLKTPGFRWLGRIFSLPGMGRIADFAYNRFLMVRPAIQKMVARLGA